MRDYLLVRLEAPLQSWGDVAVDRHRPTRAFPGLSALTGLLASGLGWTYADGDRTTALQDALSVAIREDRPGRPLRDFQTADLGREQATWTTRGRVRREGSARDGTQLLEKHYLADASFLVAATLMDRAPVSLDELADALGSPARPLFLGRKSCPPAAPLLEGRARAESGYEALRNWPGVSHGSVPCRCWYSPGDGPTGDVSRSVSDRRDFAANAFNGYRTLIEGLVTPAGEEAGV